MKIKFIFFLTSLLTGNVLFAQNQLTIHADQGKYTISKDIYGQFSEHLGHCIYGGIWVGPDSDIPNIDGYRKDVVEALKKIHIPNLRWPGGCFADEYHWKEGIGPRGERPKMINTHWGGVVEDNSFGTHEFLNFCELIGADPYIAGNLGSGTIEEMSDWVEYINFDGTSPMADMRRKNGRDKSWGVKYWGVGNESWGCGGNMTPEFYSDLYRRYATFCRNYGDNRLYKIAAGANSWDMNWTEVLMKNIPLNMMNGISLHYYTVTKTWQDKGSATDFSEDEYFTTLQKASAMDELISRHSTIMDRYDPKKRVGLIVDEWGTWYNVEPGTNPGFLYQQNTLRDAFVAGTTLNIFNEHADRVKMANLAQMVNVLQALILTDGNKMVLTPTYHVFDMYQVHQNATLIPSDLQTASYEVVGNKQPALNASVSRSADGTINISIVNIDPKNSMDLNCVFQGAAISGATGQILTASTLNAHNTFDQPDNVNNKEFKDFSIKKGVLNVKVPAKSVIVLRAK